jgi:hypothetical protein
MRHIRKGLISLWLYKENYKLWDWKKCICSTYSPTWAPHTYDFVVVTFLTHPRKILLVVLEIREAKDLSAPLRILCSACRVSVQVLFVLKAWRKELIKTSLPCYRCQPLKFQCKNKVLSVTKLKTSCTWALLEKLPIVHPLRNLLAFHGTRRLITVFTRVLHWSLSWARSIQSISSHPISLSSILILSAHLHLGLYSDLFPSGVTTNILYAFLFPIRATCPCLSHPPWPDHSDYVWRGVQVMKLLIM